MLTFNETVISRQPAIFSHPFCLKHLIAVSSRSPGGPLVYIVFDELTDRCMYCIEKLTGPEYTNI